MGICWEVSTFWFRVAFGSMLVPFAERRKWKAFLANATSFEEWSQAARELDRLEGRDRWKSTDRCEFYDHELVNSRLEQLKHAQEMEDFAAICFLLRTSIYYSSYKAFRSIKELW